jgi:hypothetical protein
MTIRMSKHTAFGRAFPAFILRTKTPKSGLALRVSIGAAALFLASCDVATDQRVWTDCTNAKTGEKVQVMTRAARFT